MRIGKYILAAVISFIFLILSAIGQQQAPKPQTPAKPGKATIPPKKTPTPPLKKEEAQKIVELRGLESQFMDKTADPCTDFYQYSCGGWLKLNPVPGDQASYGRDTELAERNRLILRDILEKAAVERPDRTAVEQKIGDFYSSCMDESAIEKKGKAALKPELDRIAALQSKDQLAEELAHLHTIDVNAFFGYGSDQDFKDATSVIAEADQGGLGLPERDYYTRTDSKSAQTRRQYVQHVTNMFRLLGDPPQAAALHATQVLKMETALAKSSLTVTERRDPSRLYHKMPVTELQGMNPTFGWIRYLRATDTPVVESLNVAVPAFYKCL